LGWLCSLLWPSLYRSSTFLVTDLPESSYQLWFTLTASHLDMSMAACRDSGSTACCLTSQAFLCNLEENLYNPTFLAFYRPKNKHHVEDAKSGHLLVLYSLGPLDP
jgi:hypothetical protein